MKNKQGKQYQSSINKTKANMELYRGRIKTGTVRDKKQESIYAKVGALGSPGRFNIVGWGMHRGVRHFSDASG